MNLDYVLADVFTAQAFQGNQLAVFPRGEDLTCGQMQLLAREFNFSESVFVLPPEKSGDFRLRIFTPEKELPMAGHPTLGAAAVLKHLKMASGERLVLELGIGPVTVEWNPSGRPSMAQEKPKFGPIFEIPDQWAPVVGLQSSDFLSGGEIQMVSCGLYYLMIPVKDKDALNRARVDLALYRQAKKAMDFGELYLWCRGEAPGVYHTRMFAPSLGIEEDPATGSAAGPFLCYLIRNGVEELKDEAARVEIHQGEALGRASTLYAQVEYGTGGYKNLQVSGDVVITGRGTLFPEIFEPSGSQKDKK